MDLEKAKKALEKALKELTPEEIEKYFPKDTKPKGWISIEEHLPMFKAMDFMQGGSVYKVKNKDGEEYESMVGDHNTWYYLAKSDGITHWWND
jgi:hypothetical protein